MENKEHNLGYIQYANGNIEPIEYIAERNGVYVRVFAIYAGTLNSRNKNLWQNKTECTDEALCAVRDYMVKELLGGIECEKATSSGYVWKLKDGRDVELHVTIKDDSPVNGKE